MNPRAPFIVIAALAWAASPAVAEPRASERCGPPAQTASANLRVDNGAVEYDFTKTREDLFHLFRENRRESAAGHRTGLTMARMNYEMQTDVRLRPVAGGFCVELRNVKVSLGFPLLKVYVDQRYPVGGCHHQAVLKHENEHVSINRRVLAKHAKEFRARLKTMVERAPVLFVVSKEQAREAHIKYLSSETKPVLDAMERDLRSGHAVIDTEESYQSLTKLCENW
jgi:hypothetical protein